MSHCKRSFHGWGSQVCHHCIQSFCSSETCVMRRVLFLSLSGSGRDDSSLYKKCLPAMLERMDPIVKDLIKHRQWWGQLKCLQQRFTSNVEKNGQAGVHKRVHQTMPYLPKIRWFWFCLFLFRFRLACNTISICCSGIKPFWNLITRVQIIL